MGGSTTPLFGILAGAGAVSWPGGAGLVDFALAGATVARAPAIVMTARAWRGRFGDLDIVGS